jgi:hypothetical protein
MEALSLHGLQKCSIKLCILTLVSVICIIIIYKTEWSFKKIRVSIFLSDFNKAVRFISYLRTNYSSVNGLRYRAMVCTVTRNDPHIAEFILRHLISGFSHIVVYDNNRILTGHDMDMRAVLEPFVVAGVVTYVPWFQDSTELFQTEDKNDQGNECIRKYGRRADWVTYLDSDEYFYFEKNNVSVNALHHLLLELEQRPLCAVTISWTMMYGEGRILRQNRTLFESYPRICNTILQTKALGRPKLTKFDIPHAAECKKKVNYTTMTWHATAGSKIGLVHYYGKSVEEFLIKTDQSMPPYIKTPIDAYREAGNICNRIQYHYSADYTYTFLESYNELKILHSLTPIALIPPPGLNINDTSDYTLSIHLKYRCAKRQEFDEKKYLSINTDAAKLIKNGAYTDGLHHFMANFLTGVIGCWKTGTYTICE